MGGGWWVTTVGRHALAPAEHGSALRLARHDPGVTFARHDPGAIAQRPRTRATIFAATGLLMILREIWQYCWPLADKLKLLQA
ncbi:hypothetical protein SN15_10530 [Stenotrophomonas maltophilia]|nr:hypothetical protein SN15_10530 [Stenotrophomonas maltophilia]